MPTLPSTPLKHLALNRDSVIMDAASSDEPLALVETSPLQIPFERDGEHSIHSQNSDDEDEDDTSPLAYARSQGLTHSYLDQDPRNSFPRLPKPANSNRDLEDLSGLYKLPTELHFTERLTLERDAAIVLQSVLCTPEPALDIEDLPKPRISTKMLRLELPLLATDNELDVRHFSERTEPDVRILSQIRPPPMDIEKDEGFEWPSKYKDLPRQLRNKIEKERPGFPRDALRSLQDALTDSFQPGDEQQLIESEMHRPRKKSFEPITPSLLLLSPPPTPFIPSSDATPVEPLSEGSSLVNQDIQRIETQLAKQDTMIPVVEGGSDPMLLDNTDELVQIYSPMQSIAQSRSSTPVKRRLSVAKVEVPLTPNDTSTPAKKLKSVSFPDKLHEFIPAFPPKTQEEIQMSEDSFEAFFQDVIEPIAMEAEQMLANERLTAADATMRVEVTSVDRIRPVCPWLEYASKSNSHRPQDNAELKSQMRLLGNIVNVIPKEYQRLHGISKIETQLKWTPFPLELSRVALEESIQDDHYMANIMADMDLENVVTSDMLVWKREGLRVLDELMEDEDQLELAEVGGLDEDLDLSALLRVRGQDLDVSMKNAQQHSNGASSHRPDHTFQAPSAVQTRGIGPSLRFDSLFSASTSLSAFMRGYGANPVNVPRTTGPTSALEETRAQPSLAVAPDPATPIRAAPQRPEPSHEFSRPPPLPVLPSILPQATIIVSSTLLAHQRKLMKELQQLYLNLDLIERDFTTPPPPLSHEADLIISPSTGIVLTTLQKIKQKPLPSQEFSYHGIKERLRDVCVRYSRLLVLVASPTDATTLDGRDCSALAELVGFTSSLNAGIQVLYLHGGDTALATWIAHCISTHHFDMSSLQKPADAEPPALLADETTWEHFLRRVGLNAFAAQVVLAELREPSMAISVGEGSSESHDSGPSEAVLLRAFITMTPESRICRFETLLGGRAVLERVNQALEQRWLSAADDFSALGGTRHNDGIAG